MGVPVSWKNDGKNFIGCNFAYADLTNNLRRLLTVNGKIHAETFVAASGAIAGFAAQQALLAQKPNFSVEALNDHSLNEGLFIVRGPNGDRYIYGDPLKEMIFLQRETADADHSQIMGMGNRRRNGCEPRQVGNA